MTSFFFGEALAFLAGLAYAPVVRTGEKKEEKKKKLTAFFGEALLAAVLVFFAFAGDAARFGEAAFLVAGLLERPRLAGAAFLAAAGLAAAFLVLAAFLLAGLLLLLRVDMTL